MSWILGQTVIYQLSTLDSSLIARINHLSLILAEVRAIIDAKQDLKISNEDYSKLTDVSANIETLRDSYEPFLDDQESQQVGAQKRKSSEKLIDISRYNLLYLIEKYKLVDVNTLKDIQGTTWGGTSD